MNVIEALTAAFGKSSERIDLSAIGGRDSEYSEARRTEVHPIELVLSDDSRVFVSCGGDVIAKLRPVSTASRVTFYIVHDDSEARSWHVRRRQLDAMIADGVRDEIDWTEYHTGCPSAQIRVVASI